MHWPQAEGGKRVPPPSGFARDPKGSENVELLRIISSRARHFLKNAQILANELQWRRANMLAHQVRMTPERMDGELSKRSDGLFHVSWFKKKSPGNPGAKLKKNTRFAAHPRFFTLSWIQDGV